MIRRLAALAAVLALSMSIAPARAGSVPERKPQGDRGRAPKTGPAVVALIDAGINPYAPAFRDRSALAYKHPSTYIPGYPKDAKALPITLDVPYDEAVKRDENLWATVVRGQLYWFPGTRIVGGISFAGGGCASTENPPPVNGGGSCRDLPILDQNGHGTMTASRAAGAPASLAPTARIVEIEGLGARGVQWAADAGWIDVQSNSWLSLVPQPVPQGTTDAFAAAAQKMVTIAASGNGSAYIMGFAPTPTYVLSTAPPGVILVGGHDNGKMTLWAGAPPHVVADAYAGMTAIRESVEPMRPDPIACCTSAAAPYAAGGALAIIQEARRILKWNRTGIDGGVVACGREGVVGSGPLADGVFTLDELRELYFATADARPAEAPHDGDIHWAGEPRPPELQPYGLGSNPFCQGCTTTPIPWAVIPREAPTYPLIGYGAVNDASRTLAFEVLQGKTPMPVRGAEDAQYEADQAVRTALLGQPPAPKSEKRVVCEVAAKG